MKTLLSHFRDAHQNSDRPIHLLVRVMPAARLRKGSVAYVRYDLLCCNYYSLQPFTEGLRRRKGDGVVESASFVTCTQCREKLVTIGSWMNACNSSYVSLKMSDQSH